MGNTLLRLKFIVFLPVVGLLIVIGALVAFTIQWAATQTDAEAGRRETALVQQLIEQRIAQITKCPLNLLSMLFLGRRTEPWDRHHQGSPQGRVMRPPRLRIIA
ncbi:hypothetical protein [Jiella pacifica]|uniref:Uncharacterized protein n=1 Tax=Jiella pacifica TaxID=2696469 RepID=A0A6N9TAQ9_9HYPH|nr:hypothetical protein [Jiella pacifica]NDW07305.1 hypothetical protein [Jiella pacifica]